MKKNESKISVHGIHGCIKPETVKKIFRIHFQTVELIPTYEDGYSTSVCVRKPYLMPNELCSVDKKGEVDETMIVFWISDLLNAYLVKKHGVYLGSRPAIGRDGKGIYYRFMLVKGF